MIQKRQYERAIDSIQNAIRLYTAQIEEKRIFRTDYPEINSDLHTKILELLPGVTKIAVDDLHPKQSGALMWIQLCHCYQQLSNWNAAYNCAQRASQIFIGYLQIGESIKKEEISSLMKLLSNLNSTYYPLIPKYPTLLEANSKSAIENQDLVLYIGI